MKELLFEANNIVKKFGPTVALNDVSIKVYRGEIRGLIGENGSGKSTLSAIMTGIHKKTSGEMVFKGESWNPKSMIDSLNQGIGICIQEAGTVPDISVAENIYLGELEKFSGNNYLSHIQDLSIYFSDEFTYDTSLIKEKLNNILNSNEDIRKDLEYKFYDLSKDERKEAKELKESIRSTKKDILTNYNNAKNIIKDFMKNDYLKIKNEYHEKFLKVNVDYKNKIANLLEQYNKDKEFINEKYNNELSSGTRDKYLIEDDRKAFLTKLHQELIIAQNIETNKFNKFESDLENDLRMLKVLIKQYAFFIKNGKRYKESSTYKIKTKILNILFAPFVNKKKLYEYSTLALKKSNLDFIDTKEKIGSYNMQHRKLVEMAKVINKNPDIFIVDETTNALTEDGRQLIYSKMEQFKKENKSVIFISHDLDEIMKVCDVLTILRDGKIVAEIEKKDFEPETIKRHMIGRQLDNHFYRQDYDSSCDDEVVLKLTNCHTKYLKNINIDLHKGEILGIGGLSDCGMHEVGKIMFGAQKMIDGSIRAGKNLDIEILNERIAMKQNIGYVSKDRDYEALSLTDSIHTNIAISALQKIKRANFMILKKDEKKIVNKEISDLSIKCNNAEQIVSTLSGGNKQKVSLAKWLGNESEILILDCPTRGVDIGVKQFIYDLLYKMKKEGKAILMISEELPELIGMSDRILIMKEGQITSEFKRDPSLTQEKIVDYMI